MEDMARIVTVAEAETGFGELLRQVAEGHADWRRQVDQAREMIAVELGGRRLPPAEEILRRARDERDAQLLDLR